LLASLIVTTILWYLQGWRPNQSFSRRSLGTMYNFGYKLFLSGLLDTVFNNLFVVVIAKLFTASIAGYYFFAEKLRELAISQLVGSIQNVTYPALATMQSDDKRLKAGYRKVIQVTTFILFPSMLLLAALAEPLFKVLLPAKWLPAVLYLQLMCIAGVMYPLHAINLNVLKVKGRSDLFLYLEILKKIMVLIILVISYRYGVIGILIGQIISSVVAYIPNSYFSAELINYSVREQMSDFIPGLTLSSAVALTIYGAGFLMHWPALAKLSVLAMTAGILYLAAAHFLKLHAYVLARQTLTARISRSV
jgi:O-antigen/teichoic acid export membrane protein